MKYLLCYSRPEWISAESKIYTDFADAVKSYTLICAQYDHVVLADLEREVIIRQYEYVGDGAACIF